MIQNKRIAFVLYVVLFMVVWNVLDVLYAALIAHTGYQFTAGTDLFIPLVVAALTGYILFLRDRGN